MAAFSFVVRLCKERRESRLSAHAQTPACLRLHGFCRRCRRWTRLRMNLLWFCGRGWTPPGLIGLGDIAAILTFVGVGLAM
eukprot:6090285-Amphidinium_carterae.1